MSANNVFTALVAFAGGVAAGILMAPRAGSETRELLADEARSQMKRMDRQLRSLESQLAGISDQLKKASDDASRRVRQATVDQVVPEVPDDPEAFQVDGEEVTGDLRHMPKK